jgi:hypothetical protein
LSPSGSARWPVVAPSGAIVPRGGTGRVGAQLVAPAAAGGAVWAGGVAGDGGAWAIAVPVAATSTHERMSECLICMRENGPRAPMFRPSAGTFQALR